MTTKALFQAIDAIDAHYIIEAQEEAVIRTHRRRRNRRTAAVCACFAVLLVGALTLPGLLHPARVDGDGQQQMADINYGFYLNGLDYQPFGAGDYARYPVLSSMQYSIQYSITREQRNELIKRMAGEIVGTVPADENFGPGTVYRVAAYPDYDSIRIMYRDGNYEFYVSDGNSLYHYFAETGDRSSGNAFAFHGLPESILTVQTELIDGEALGEENTRELFAILSDREDVEYAVWAARVVALWAQTYGTDEVRLNERGEGLSYDATDRDVYERLMQLTKPQTIWIATDRGFDELLICYYPQFSMFTFCNVMYELQPDEVTAINTLLDLE